MFDSLNARDEAVVELTGRALDVVEDVIQYFTYSVPGGKAQQIGFGPGDTVADAMSKAGVPVSDKMTLISKGQQVNPAATPVAGQVVTPAAAASNG